MVILRRAVSRSLGPHTLLSGVIRRLAVFCAIYGISSLIYAQDRSFPPIYDVTVIERAIERVVFAFAGVICVYFGYRLFYVVTTQASEAKFQGRDYSIALKDVGPGVLFCLFGCLLMGLSIVYGPSIGPNALLARPFPPKPDSRPASISSAGVYPWAGAVGAQVVDDTPRELWALGTVRQRLNQAESAPTGTATDTPQIDRLLYQVQLRLLRGKFPEEDIASYELLAQMRKDNVKEFQKIVNGNAKRRASFEAIDQAIDGDSP